MSYSRSKSKTSSLFLKSSYPRPHIGVQSPYNRAECMKIYALAAGNDHYFTTTGKLVPAANAQHNIVVEDGENDDTHESKPIIQSTIAITPAAKNGASITIIEEKEENANAIADVAKNDNENDVENDSQFEYSIINGKYTPKPLLKTVEIRHRYNWFRMTFKNCEEFYKFLDQFRIFGLIENDKPQLCVTHFQDLKCDISDGRNRNIHNNNNNNNSVSLSSSSSLVKYRTIKFSWFDFWIPFYTEPKNVVIVDKYSIAKSAVAMTPTVPKTIGLRNHFHWMQVVFRYEWEFDKFIRDSQCYGLVQESNGNIVREWQFLESVDYRLIKISDWDEFTAEERDPNMPVIYGANNETPSGSLAAATGGSGSTATSGALFSSKSSTRKTKGKSSSKNKSAVSSSSSSSAGGGLGSWFSGSGS